MVGDRHGFYTIAEMVKQYSLNPYLYLKYLLEQSPACQTTDADLNVRTMVGEYAGYMYDNMT